MIKMKLKNYNDIKAFACIKGMKMETEIPNKLGYKSRWGLKLALKNPRKREEILKKAKKIFLDK